MGSRRWVVAGLTLNVLFVFLIAHQAQYIKAANWYKFCFLVFLVFCVFSSMYAIACYKLAKQKQHNAKRWAIAGFIFTLWAYLIFYFCVPDSHK